MRLSYLNPCAGKMTTLYWGSLRQGISNVTSEIQLHVFNTEPPWLAVAGGKRWWEGGSQESL